MAILSEALNILRPVMASTRRHPNDHMSTFSVGEAGGGGGSLGLTAASLRPPSDADAAVEGHVDKGRGERVTAASPRFLMRARPRRHSCEESSQERRGVVPPPPMDELTEEVQEFVANVESVLKLTLEPV